MSRTIVTAISPCLWIFIGSYISCNCWAPKLFTIIVSNICTRVIFFFSPNEWKFTCFIYHWTIYCFACDFTKEYYVNYNSILKFYSILKSRESKYSKYITFWTPPKISISSSIGSWIGDVPHYTFLHSWTVFICITRLIHVTSNLTFIFCWCIDSKPFCLLLF